MRLDLMRQLRTSRSIWGFLCTGLTALPNRWDGSGVGKAHCSNCDRNPHGVRGLGTKSCSALPPLVSMSSRYLTLGSSGSGVAPSTLGCMPGIRMPYANSVIGTELDAADRK